MESSSVFVEPRVKLAELLARLRRTYTGSIGVEFMQMLDSERRRWLHAAHGADARTGLRFSVDEQRHLLTLLS